MLRRAVEEFTETMLDLEFIHKRFNQITDHKNKNVSGDVIHKLL